MSKPLKTKVLQKKYYMRGHTHIWLNILLISLCLNISSYAQTWDYYNKDVTFTIHHIDSGYIANTQYYGINPKRNLTASITYDTFETVRNIRLFSINKKGRLKEFKKIEISDTDVLSDVFQTGRRVKSFKIPAETRFMYEYERLSNENIYLSNLPFFGGYNTDTFNYQITLSPQLHLLFDPQNTDKLAEFNIDSTINEHCKTYLFNGVIQSDALELHSYDHSKYFIKKEYPYVRLLLTPANYKSREAEYFNSWYLERINTLPGLNDQNKELIDKITKTHENQDSIILSVYNYARKKIKYVDVEIGLGGLIPHNVNYICKKLQGDCKDYSNFMWNALRYKGLDARLAISSTLSHFGDMDFPTISGGNHMICVVKKDTGWIFLDGTETSGIYGLPGRFIQGRHIFILGDSPDIVYVEPVKMISIQIHLK